MSRLSAKRHDIVVPMQRRGDAFGRQSGAATLIVVMVLFFVMSLVAAYSSRNIIFEQRTSSNLQSANTVQETAEAGIEWVLSLLNSANISNTCAPNLDPGSPTPTFRQRYLSTDAGGNIAGTAAYPAGTAVAMCGFDQANQQWSCSCPTVGAPALPAFSPAFSVRFVVPASARPGAIRTEVNACTLADAACLNFQPQDAAFCKATACVVVALHSGLKFQPPAALTARLDVGDGAMAQSIIGPSGLTIWSGGAVNLGPSASIRGPAGTPPERTLAPNDPFLSHAAFTPERMFAMFFGVWPTTYDQHPGAVTVDCSAGCASSAVRNAWIVNPDRIILLQGDVTLDGGGNIGSPTSPVLLVVQGNLTFAAATDIYGFVYVRTADWVTSGPGQIIGGAAAQGQVRGTGSFTVAHDRAVLELLRLRTGSMVKVPGSWVDFQQ
jgi:hypothetical protein